MSWLDSMIFVLSYRMPMGGAIHLQVIPDMGQENLSSMMDILTTILHCHQIRSNPYGKILRSEMDDRQEQIAVLKIMFRDRGLEPLHEEWIPGGEPWDFQTRDLYWKLGDNLFLIFGDWTLHLGYHGYESASGKKRRNYGYIVLRYLQDFPADIFHKMCDYIMCGVEHYRLNPTKLNDPF